MNPKKISVFVFLVLAALLALTLVSQSINQPGGKTEEGFSLGFSILKYPKLSSFMQSSDKVEHKKEIDSIVQNIQTAVVEEIPEKPETPNFSVIDTSKIVRIDYPENKVAFLETLRSQFTSGNCRIVHYGDSQLEGDRISAYVRNRLQGLYGGQDQDLSL